MSEDQNKFPLVLWSGGMDSTLLVSKLLEKGDVYTMYIDCGQCPNKVEKEKAAREKARQQFSAWHEEGNLSGIIRSDISVDVNHIVNDISYRKKYTQPVAWLLGAMMRFNSEKHSGIYLSYVIGDQITSQLDDIKQMWAAMWRITHWGEVPPLNFYLIDEGYDKFRVVEELYVKLRDKVWVCELPKWDNRMKTHKSCKTGCTACLTLEKAKHEYKLRYGSDYVAESIRRLNQDKQDGLCRKIDPVQNVEDDNVDACN